MYVYCIVYNCILYIYVRLAITPHVTLTVYLISSPFVCDKLSNTYWDLDIVYYMYMHFCCLNNNPYIIIINLREYQIQLY